MTYLLKAICNQTSNWVEHAQLLALHSYQIIDSFQNFELRTLIERKKGTSDQWFGMIQKAVLCTNKWHAGPPRPARPLRHRLCSLDSNQKLAEAALVYSSTIFLNCLKLVWCVFFLILTVYQNNFACVVVLHHHQQQIIMQTQKK